MYNNGKWENPKVVMYCQIGGAIDMAEFAINGEFGALKNTGLNDDEFDIVFICWKTPEHTYDWLKKNNFKYVDMEYDEGKGFLWNLYKGWNLGYEIGYQYADYICPIATDHAFHKNWLANLLKHGKENRIVNCKLIEPGVGVSAETLHTAKNLGPTIEGEFKSEEFIELCESLEKSDELVFEGCNPAFRGGPYGHRLDAMPFLVHRTVWDKFGPMFQVLDSHGLTGDVNFFDRCFAGGVEVTKSLDGISYHCGGAETMRNRAKGIYT